MQNLRKVQNCAEALKAALPEGCAPKIGIVLGTGLDGIARVLEKSRNIAYADLPDFPASTAPSHKGRFAAGFLAGVPVLLQQGRCHLYEGREPHEVCMGVRVMALCGITSLIITNAAGAINPGFDAGALMLIEDHINTTGKSPLTGPNDEAFGPRFPDMSRPYDPEFAALAQRRALEMGIALERGVYVCVPGPQLETRAETRAYRLMGGDAVGMSTALEVVAAAHLGLRVLGLSCLTNKNLPDCMEKTSIEEIVQAAEKTAGSLQRLILGLLPDMA